MVTLACATSALFIGAQAVAPFLADALVVLGVLMLTVGVYGVVRLPDAYTRLHAAGKAVSLGLLPLLMASALAGNPDVVPRVFLIAFFLLVTTPVSAHVIGRAAFLRREEMRTPEAVNESDRDLGNPSSDT